MTETQYTAKFNRLAKYCLRLINTEEHKNRQFVKGLRVDLHLQRALAPLPPIIFTATRTEIADQMAKQRTVAMNASFHPYKRQRQGRWRP